MADDSISAVQRVTENPDLLVHICTFADLRSIGAITKTCHVWREPALRPECPHWSTCDQANFLSLGPSQLLSLGSPTRWNADSVSRLLAAKPQLVSLDLTRVRVLSAADLHHLASQLQRCSALQTFRLSHCVTGTSVGDAAVLDSLLSAIESLPLLRVLDVGRILSDDILLQRRRNIERKQRAQSQSSLLRAVLDALPSFGAPSPRAHEQGVAHGPGDAPSVAHQTFVRTLPALEVLSVGLNLFTPIGRRDGRLYVLEQLAKSPSLRRIGCQVAAALCVPIDLHCRLCGAAIYRNLTEYIVHPPQQPHISYEIHTNQAPLEGGSTPVDGDPSRLQCHRRCHEPLWLIDLGSHGVQHVCGKRYAIACGPATRYTIPHLLHHPPFERAYPGLAVALPAAAAEAAAAIEPSEMVDWFPCLQEAVQSEEENEEDATELH